MKRLSFVLVIIFGFGFVTVCFAMGKLNTQDKNTVQDITKEAETVVAQSYSAPEEVAEIEDSMNEDVWFTQDSIQGSEVFVGEPEMALETNVTVDSEAAQEQAQRLKDFTKTEVVTEVKAAVETESTNKLGILDELGVTNEFYSLDNIVEKVDFLLNKANELYKTKQFQKAVDVCQYILQHLDAGYRGEEVNNLLNKAMQKTL